MSPRCQVLTDVHDVRRLSHEWAALLSRSSVDEPTLSPLWLLSWWAVFGGRDRSLVVIAVREGDRLIALAPLVSRVHWYRPGIPFRRLELLGSGEDEHEEIASSYLGVIAERGAEPMAANALADALAGEQVGGWDELVCPRVRTDARPTHGLVGALAARGIGLRIRHENCAHYARLPSSWDAYLQTLSSSRRYRLRRTLRDFDAWAGGDVAVHQATTHEELATGMDILWDLHAQRWQAAGHRGAFAAPRFRRFHEIVMPKLFDLGGLRLLWLTARGTPVACVYNIAWSRRVRFYQSGRRVDLPSRLRPGVVLHARAIQRSIEEGFVEYDFLSGSARYKREMSNQSRPTSVVRATRSALFREGARRLITAGVSRARALRDALNAQESGA